MEIIITKKDKWRLLMFWLFFSIFLSSIPIFYALWKFCGLNSISLLKGYKDVLQHGQLALISVPVLGALAGDFFYTDYCSKIAKIILGGFCLLLIVFTSSIIQDFSNPDMPLDYKVETSMYIFISTFIIGCMSKFLNRKE